MRFGAATIEPYRTTLKRRWISPKSGSISAAKISTAAKLRLAAEGRYANSPDPFTKWRLESRLRMLELVYSERYDRILNSFPGEPKNGIDVYHWHELVAPRERTLHHEVSSPL
jgi:hypothetical protein